MSIGKNSLKRAGAVAAGTEKKEEVKAKFAVPEKVSDGVSADKTAAAEKAVPTGKAVTAAKKAPAAKTAPAAEKTASKAAVKTAAAPAKNTSPKAPAAKKSAEGKTSLIYAKSDDVLDSIYDNAAAEKALAKTLETVKAYGIVQPVGLKDIGGKYKVIYGHELVYAAKKLGIKEIPAIVFSENTDAPAIAKAAADFAPTESEVREAAKTESTSDTAAEKELPFYLL